ncbi:MAG: prepilin-type N-terminal cleavage/methylation domain-containing protein, partial [Gammaproteobacteria bacterium]|nr:prepilin-type N-terminal cleavage/methylation domain-containing protein [Gammaproteobacteria bacterium]
MFAKGYTLVELMVVVA